jgi:hypothetical protein
VSVGTPLRAPSNTGSAAWRRRSARLRTSLVIVPVIAALVALVVGVVLGRTTAPPQPVEGVAVVEVEVVPLSVDADGLWTGGAGELPAIGDQLLALRRDDETAVIDDALEGWLEAYDTVLRRMIGVDVPPSVRPVQRQFVNAVTLSRDAVEVLGAAAATEDVEARQELSAEALRLRTRSEQITQSARASLADAAGRGSSGTSTPGQLPTFDELR